MKKLLIGVVIVSTLIGWSYLSTHNNSPFPEFSDEMNMIICIEEGIL